MFFTPPINYHEPIFRPPSEAKSLLIQVTIGCSNNKCTYCDMYRSKKYSVRSLNQVMNDLNIAKAHFDRIGIFPDKVFLCDGDALGAPFEFLSMILDNINILFPNLRRIGVYATADNILKKSERELEELYKKKLSIAYLGLESGDDQVLHKIVKGNTSQEMIQASKKIKNAGFQLSTIVMLGVGGQELSGQHTVQTAKILGQTSPHFLSFLTTFAVPGTPYHKMIERKIISPLFSKELLQEMYDIIEQTHFTSTPVIFRANHVSNMYPLSGTLPRDKEKILNKISQWIAETPNNTYPIPPSQM